MAELPEWLRITPGGVALQLHIQPGAKRSELAGVHGDALKLRLAAPPVEGRANAALIEFLADLLGVARRDVHLISGEASRRKRVEIAGVDAATVRARLGA